MKAKLDVLMVLIVVVTMYLAAGVTNADLVAHYEFEGDFNDTSDNELHATAVNGASITTDNVKIGMGAANFDRSLQQCAETSASPFTQGDYSYAAWYYLDLADITGSNRYFILESTNTARNNYPASYGLRDSVGVDIGQVYTHRSSGGGPNFSFPGGSNRTWHHIAVTYDAAVDGGYYEAYQAYLDGVLVGSMTGPAGSTLLATDLLVIGGHRAGTGRNFQGQIDDVVVFNNALSEAEIRQLYKLGGKSFISEELRIMNSAIREAERLLKEQRPEKAVGFLERRIAEYEQWQLRNPNDVKSYERLLSSDIYFLLARAKEAANVPTQDVTAAYKKTALVSMRQTKYVSALLWLFNNIPAADYVDVVKKSVRRGDDASDNIHHIAKDFESRGNWPAFKFFLDAIFSEVNDTTSYAEAIAEGLKKNGVWANNFSKYCRSKPELAEYVIEVNEEPAQEHMRQEEFLKAAEIYRDIVNQCGPDQDKTIYELKVCECIFNSGQYASAIPELNRFIRNNKATNRVLVKQAILLKGRAYIQLGEMGRAYNAFLELMIDDPETKQAPEANFFIGYCNMLQGKYKEATEALNMVVKDYSQSSYASKARLCLTRIKRMTE